MKIESNCFLVIILILFQLLNIKSMLAVLHSDISSLKSCLLRLTGKPYCKKGRSAKVKDGIKKLSLLKNLIDRCKKRNFRNKNYRIDSSSLTGACTIKHFTTVIYRFL